MSGNPFKYVRDWRSGLKKKLKPYHVETWLKPTCATLIFSANGKVVNQFCEIVIAFRRNR